MLYLSLHLHMFICIVIIVFLFLNFINKERTVPFPFIYFPLTFPGPGQPPDPAEFCGSAVGHENVGTDFVPPCDAGSSQDDCWYHNMAQKIGVPAPLCLLGEDPESSHWGGVTAHLWLFTRAMCPSPFLPFFCWLWFASLGVDSFLLQRGGDLGCPPPTQMGGFPSISFEMTLN